MLLVSDLFRVRTLLLAINNIQIEYLRNVADAGGKPVSILESLGSSKTSSEEIT
jgi:hypothetical protein